MYALLRLFRIAIVSTASFTTDWKKC